MRNVFRHTPMQEPIEHRLSQMPLRRTPAHWRHAILEKAHAAPEASPQSSPSRISPNWLALAAAWTLIALLQWDANLGSATPKADSLPGGLYVPNLSAFRSPEAYLEELLAEPPSNPPAPKQSRHTAQKATAIA